MAQRNNLISTLHGQAPAPEYRDEEGRSAEEIRKDIAARRDSITETVDKLSDRIHRKFDWRTYINDYPLVVLGVAAGLGFLLYRTFKHRPTPGERIKDALADSVEEIAGQFRNRIEDLTSPRQFGLGRTIKAAATGAITKAAADYVRKSVYGSPQQYHGHQEKIEYDD
ncbi:MAG: DUF3618 domain-containing protein [Acidobacteria bacterium]|nr:DUF3618 domain-containing protein [Acidobacteriota bacterium]